MIHHISIAAHQPQHVSEVLAEILQGQSIPFSAHLGSYIALALDAQGTLIEVLPFGTVLFPGIAADAAVEFHTSSISSQYMPHHAAISVPVSTEQIQAIANREGWRLAHCNRQDYFEVLEFWVENQLLIEFLPPDLAAKYLAFMDPQSLLQAVQVVAS